MNTELSQVGNLKQHLLELLKPSTTPEKALQSLSSPIFSIKDHNPKDEKPLKIFLAFMDYIIFRGPNAPICGIWE